MAHAETLDEASEFVSMVLWASLLTVVLSDPTLYSVAKSLVMNLWNAHETKKRAFRRDVGGALWFA